MASATQSQLLCDSRLMQGEFVQYRRVLQPSMICISKVLVDRCKHMSCTSAVVVPRFIGPLQGYTCMVAVVVLLSLDCWKDM